MKMRLLLLVLILSAVGTAVSATIPASLPIGNKLAEGAKIRVEIGYDDGESDYSYTIDSWSTSIYRGADGTIEQVLNAFLKSVISSYVPTPGTETADRLVDVTIVSVLGENWQNICTKRFIVEMKDLSKIVVADLHYIPNYTAILIPGLKSVLLDVTTLAGAVLFYESSENGVSNPLSCFYNAPITGYAYQGPDVLEIYSMVAIPSLQPEGGIKGSVTLYFDNAKTIWAKYDVNGNKLDQSPNLPLVKTTPVVTGNALQISTEGTTGSLPAGAYTVEESPSLASPVWTTVGTLDSSTGSITVPTTGPSRFYRIKKN